MLLLWLLLLFDLGVVKIYLLLLLVLLLRQLLYALVKMIPVLLEKLVVSHFANLLPNLFSINSFNAVLSDDQIVAFGFRLHGQIWLLTGHRVPLLRVEVLMLTHVIRLKSRLFVHFVHSRGRDVEARVLEAVLRLCNVRLRLRALEAILEIVGPQFNKESLILESLQFVPFASLPLLFSILSAAMELVWPGVPSLHVRSQEVHKIQLLPEVLDLVVELIESFVLNSLLVAKLLEAAGNEVIENGLGLMYHVFVKAMTPVGIEEVHVGHLLDAEEVQWALLIRIALRNEQLKYHQEANDRIPIKLQPLIVIVAISIWRCQRNHDQIDVLQQLICGSMLQLLVQIWIHEHLP